MKTPIVLIALLATATAWADTPIDRCTTLDGKTYFSNTGCNGADRAERHQIKETTAVDSNELRDWAKRSPPKREPRAIVIQQPQPKGPKDPFACENAKRMYNFEKGYRYGKNTFGRYAEMLEACKIQ